MISLNVFTAVNVLSVLTLGTLALNEFTESLNSDNPLTIAVPSLVSL